MNDGTLLGIALGGLMIHNRSQKERMESLERTIRETHSSPITHEVTRETVREVVREEESRCPSGWELINRAAAEDVLKDCGHSNSLDFGSRDILYS